MSVVRDAAIRSRLPSPTAQKALLKATGTREAALAREMGLTRTTICGWVNGRRSPSPAHAERYLEILDSLRRVLSGEAAS